MFTTGKYKAAVNIWTNLCLVRYRELLGTHPFTASLLHYIGDAYQKLGDPKRAVAFKKESLAMRKFLLGNICLAQSIVTFYNAYPFSLLAYKFNLFKLISHYWHNEGQTHQHLTACQFPYGIT